MLETPEFRLPCFGRENLAHQHFSRHRHDHGYIALVLSGHYEEAGFAGRFTVEPGNAVVHQSFDAHLNNIALGGAAILNLPLPPGARMPAAFRIRDPDEIARLAERDMHAASLALVPVGQIDLAGDWPDLLALELSKGSEANLGAWAEQHGFARETLSRGFYKAYGTTPARFRLEARAHRALRLILESDAPIAEVAADSGFSDQPHLTRAIVQLAGRPPGYWRRTVKSVQDQSEAVPLSAVNAEDDDRDGGARKCASSFPL